MRGTRRFARMRRSSMLVVTGKGRSPLYRPMLVRGALAPRECSWTALQFSSSTPEGASAPERSVFGAGHPGNAEAVGEHAEVPTPERGRERHGDRAAIG